MFDANGNTLKLIAITEYLDALLQIYGTQGAVTKSFPTNHYFL
jgi:hypothetical protein